MATKVVMEALSPTMEEGRLVEWKKAEGDKVATGDVLAEVETDKAVMELVARADGVLLAQVVPAGSTAPVASVVGWIGAAGEAVPGGATGDKPAPPSGEAGATSDKTTGDKATGDKATGDKPAPPREAAAEPLPPARDAKAAEDQPAPPSREAGAAGSPLASSDGRIKASPVARRIAADKGLDLGAIA